MHYEKALDISREIGDRKNEGSWLGNLGSAYSNLGQIEKAMFYYKKALDISREIGDRKNEGSWLGNLGVAYGDLGQIEKAIEYHEQALSISREIEDRMGEGSTLTGIAVQYFQLENIEKAKKCIIQALTIFEEIKSPHADILKNCLSKILNLGQEIKSPNADDYLDQHSKYKVIIHNDDVTTMEFVVYVIEKLFSISLQKAIKIMLNVHNNGAGYCGIFSYEEALEKVALVNALAGANGFPLKSTMEKYTE